MVDSGCTYDVDEAAEDECADLDGRKELCLDCAPSLVGFSEPAPCVAALANGQKDFSPEEINATTCTFICVNCCSSCPTFPHMHLFAVLLRPLHVDEEVLISYGNKFFLSQRVVVCCKGRKGSMNTSTFLITADGSNEEVSPPAFVGRIAGAPASCCWKQMLRVQSVEGMECTPCDMRRFLKALGKKDGEFEQLWREADAKNAAVKTIAQRLVIPPGVRLVHCQPASILSISLPPPAGAGSGMVDVFRFRVPHVAADGGEPTTLQVAVARMAKKGTCEVHLDVSAEHSKKYMKVLSCAVSAAFNERIAAQDVGNEEAPCAKKAKVEVEMPTVTELTAALLAPRLSLSRRSAGGKTRVPPGVRQEHEHYVSVIVCTRK